MSSKRDPETDQQPPIHNDQPSCHDLAIELLQRRKDLGLSKYGTILQAFNGRDFVRDFLEEEADAFVYKIGLAQEIVENGRLLDWLRAMNETAWAILRAHLADVQRPEKVEDALEALEAAKERLLALSGDP